MTDLGGGRQLGPRSLAALFKGDCKWPNPEASAGKHIRNMGLQRCYEAVGPAREEFDLLAKEINEFLENRTESVSANVSWSLYMFGRSRESSRPTIAFCSSEREARRSVRKSVTRSGILDRHPGFTTMDCNRPPEFGSPVVSLAGNGMDWEPSDSSASHNIIDRRKATAGSILKWQGRHFLMTVGHVFEIDTRSTFLNSDTNDDFEFDFNDIDEIDGDDAESISRGSMTSNSVTSDTLDVKALSSSTDSQEIQTATVSASSARNENTIPIKLRGGVSVTEHRHPQLRDVTKKEDASNEEEPKKKQFDKAEPGKREETLFESDVLKKEGKDNEAGFTQLRNDKAAFQGPFVSSSDGSHSSLDYALIEITGSDLAKCSSVLVIDASTSREIFIQGVARNGCSSSEILAVNASRGAIHGHMSRTPTYMQPAHSTSQQELWTVSLQGELEKGDCGAWVIDAKTGLIYGHLIAGSLGSGSAYVVPLWQIFDDIQQLLGGQWWLAGYTLQRGVQLTQAFTVPYSLDGDTIALMKLAYTLYSRASLVERDAPYQFKALRQDLNEYKNVLYRIRSQKDSMSDTFDGVAALQKVTNLGFHTLYGLRDLITKYENLAWSDRGGFSKRISFAKDQDAITGIQEKLKEHQQLLQLTLTPQSRKHLNEKFQRGTIYNDDKTSIMRTGSEGDVAYGFAHTKRASTTAITDSARTLYTPREGQLYVPPRTVEPGSKASRERTPSSWSSSKESLETVETLDGWESLQTFNLGANSVTTPETSCPSWYDRVQPGGSDGSGIDERHVDNPGANSVSTPETSCPSWYDRLQPGGSGIDERHIETILGSPLREYKALSGAGPQFSDQWPLQTKTQEALVLPEKREKHNVILDVHDLFRSSFESVKIPVPAERWLRLAMWWLVKSRIISRILATNGAERSTRATDAPQHKNRWHSTVSAEQAYSDLLKSSWILEEIILVGAVDGDLSYSSVRKMIEDLSASLHNDLLESKNVNRGFKVFEDDVPLKYDLHLLESFEQTIEAEEMIPAAMDDPISALRWFKIDQDNAGMQHEKMLFRTFVNAQLGSLDDRSKSSSAPYMLLVWTTANSCDILVSLCNQQGSVNLSRKLAAEDLEKYQAGADNTIFSVDFPAQGAEIKFLSSDDAAGFFAQPLIYFTALEEVKPRSGELIIHQTSLSAYNDFSPQALHRDGEARTLVSSKTSSCGLRLYELISDKCWKTTRRLVVNAPPDSTKPECVSHWLPVDHIKMIQEGTKLTIKWSDCGHLKRKQLGSFNFQYSYIYKTDEANRKVVLEFDSSSDAQLFERCVLLPTEIPPQVSVKIGIFSASQAIRIYRLTDVDEPDQQYHSIALTKFKGSLVTETYYAYRDLDWVLSTKNGTQSIVDFPSLETSHYVSTIPRLLYRPNAKDPAPEFSHVEQALKSAHFEFGCDDDLKRFMYGLTGWTLKFFRPLSKLHLVETGHLINRKEQYKGVLVQLWEKETDGGQPQVQLAVRLGEDIKERWITASLFEAHCRSKFSTMNNNLEFQALLLQRGIEVDTKYMNATTTRGLHEQVEKRKRWKATLTFESMEHKDEFLRASGLIMTPVPLVG